MSATRPKRFDAFLSYNSQDSPAVHELAERLTAEGLVLYLEEWELALGREFQPALAEGLTGSKACVVFLGPNGLGPWQKEELQVANDMRARDEAFHVIPVLLPGAERPRGGRCRPPGVPHQRVVGRVPQDARRRAGLPGPGVGDHGDQAPGAGQAESWPRESHEPTLLSKLRQ
jgi:TIR domain